MGKKIRLLAFNSFSNAAVSILSNIVSLFTLPLLIYIYTEDLYGVLQTALGLCGVAMFDFGVTKALTRYMAQYRKGGEKQPIEDALSISRFLLVIVSFSVLLLMWGFSYYTASLFDVPKEYVPMSERIFQITAVYAFVFWLSKYLHGILIGCHKIYVKNLHQLVSIVFQIIGFIVAYYYTASFELYIIIILGGKVVSIVLDAVYIWRNKFLVGLKPQWIPSKVMFKSEFMRYSIDVFLLTVLSYFSIAADQNIIAFIMEPKMVTRYVILSKLMLIVRMFDGFIFSALEPLVAEESKSKENLKVITQKSLLIHASFLIPLSIMLMLCIEPFLKLWKGGLDYQYWYWGALGIAVYFVGVFISTPAKVIVSKGDASVMRNIQLITIPINVVVSIILTYWLGIGGVFVGTFLQVLIQIPMVIKKANQLFGLTIKTLFPPLFWVAFIYCSLIGIVFFFVNQQLPFGENWLWFILVFSIESILLGLVPLFVLYKTGLFHKLLSR